MTFVGRGIDVELMSIKNGLTFANHCMVTIVKHGDESCDVVAAMQRCQFIFARIICQGISEFSLVHGCNKKH